MAIKHSHVPRYNRLAFYHQNEALLIQFLLHECLQTHTLLKQQPNRSLLEHVIGEIRNSHQPGFDAKGHLPKLVHYASLMFTHFDALSSSNGQQIAKTLEEACLSAKTCHSHLENESEEHLKFYTRLRKQIRQLVKLIFEKLPLHRENPSMLYFLLRNQKQFDALFHKPIIKQTFYTLFPEGREQAHQFLAKKFSNKGFSHLLPHIENQLINLQFDEN